MKRVFRLMEDGQIVESWGDDDLLIYELDPHDDFSYDQAAEFINAVLESDMDGPTQMHWIERVSAAFMEQHG
jgi:hypothetical protein